MPSRPRTSVGLTAVGDTTALHRVIDARAFDSAQVVYNMLNPSAATELPPNFPAQDNGRLYDVAVTISMDGPAINCKRRSSSCRFSLRAGAERKCHCQSRGW